MDIQRIAIENIRHAPYNTRKDLKPGDPQYEKLKLSIAKYEFVEPVVWNKRSGNIVGGHQCAKVLSQLGAREIDCVVVDLDEQNEKALNIALNKVTGDWDEDKLAALLTDLNASDFDMSMTGFDTAEIDALFKDDLKDNVKDDDLDVDGELMKPAVSRLGDVWLLGRHRLICGDSTKAESFDVLVDGRKANLVVTDPP